MFGPSIPESNGTDRPLNWSDTYAAASQRWLSASQENMRSPTARLNDLCLSQQLDTRLSECSKPAPRRPRPAFLGCHLPIPATEVAETKPFPLTAPRYTAEELSLPRPYNSDYPHPLTVYASPAVNPATVAASGYAPLLKKLQEQPEVMMGNILAECGKPNVTALALTLDRDSKEGCGIPEKYWLRLSSWEGVKVPLGAVVPFARSGRSAPRLGGSRSESSPLSTALSSFSDLPSLREAHTLPSMDLAGETAFARFTRRSSDAAIEQPQTNTHWSMDRRGELDRTLQVLMLGSLPNLSRLQSTRETTRK